MRGGEIVSFFENFLISYCILYFFLLFKQMHVISIIDIYMTFVLVAKSCSYSCDPMYCSPPGFFVHGILHARLLEWVGIYFSRASYKPRDWTRVSFIVCRIFTDRASREAFGIYCCYLIDKLCPTLCNPLYL